jgi:hypothetical protein
MNVPDELQRAKQDGAIPLGYTPSKEESDYMGLVGGRKYTKHRKNEKTLKKKN